jgi:prevent-host-death family protein
MCEMYASYMTTVISTVELRDKLADVIDNARHDEVTIVTRRGHEAAAIVPISALAALRRYEEAEVLAMIDASLADPRPSVPMSEVIAETLARSE